MKNISLMALLTALSVAPNNAVAFNDAAISGQNTALERKQEVASAIGREPIQADMADAAALRGAAIAVDANSMVDAAVLRGAAIAVDADSMVDAAALRGAAIDVTADNMTDAAALRGAAIDVTADNMTDAAVLRGAAIAVDADNITATHALLAAGAVAADLNTPLLAAVNTAPAGGHKTAMINFIGDQHVLPGGIAEVTNTALAGVPGFRTEYKTLIVRASTAGPGIGDQLWVTTASMPGLNLANGDFVAYRQANQPAAALRRVAGNYTTLDNQAQ